MIQKDVIRALGSLPFLRIWRSNSGNAHSEDGTRMVKFGVTGQADISGLILPYGRRLEIEVKTPTGRQSEAQVKFGNMIQAMGGVYAVVRSAAEALEVIEEVRLGFR